MASEEVLRSLDYERDVESLRVLANNAFRSDRPGDMIAEYPTLVSAKNADNCLVFADGARVVSHVGAAYRSTVWGSFTCLSVEIGCVVTSPDVRTGGRATRLMHEAISRAKSKGAAVMFISGTRSLYTRLGAVECGRFPCVRLAVDALRSGVSEADARLIAGGTTRQATAADLGHIERLRSELAYRFVIPRDELQLLLDAQFAGNLPAHWWLWFDGATRRPVVWAVVNDMADKSTLRVVDFAGRVELLPAFVLHLRNAAYPHCQHVEYEAALPSQMPVAWLPEAKCVPLHGTVLLLDVDYFVRNAVAPVCPPGLTCLCSADDHAATFTLETAAGGRLQRTFAGPQLERLLFDGVDGVDDELNQVLADVFPLPLLRYGLSFI